MDLGGRRSNIPMWILVGRYSIVPQIASNPELSAKEYALCVIPDFHPAKQCLKFHLTLYGTFCYSPTVHHLAMDCITSALKKKTKNRLAALHLTAHTYFNKVTFPCWINALPLSVIASMLYTYTPIAAGCPLYVPSHPSSILLELNTLLPHRL